MANDGGQQQQTQQSTTQTQQTQSTQAAWTDSLGDDLKSFVSTKGFKEPKDVVDSYRNLEKLHGVPKERLLQLPEKLDSPEMRSVWERLGAPKEAKEYSVEIPKEYGDEKLAEWAKETFHKLNMPRGMAESFVKAWNERSKNMIDGMVNEKTAELKNQQEALRKEWGSAYDQNINIGAQAAQKFGITNDEVKAFGAVLGPKKAAILLHKIGQGIGEAPYVNGGGANPNISTPDQAKGEIQRLMSDSDFVRRLSAKDSEATAKWDKLHKEAFPGQISI